MQFYRLFSLIVCFLGVFRTSRSDRFTSYKEIIHIVDEPSKGLTTEPPIQKKNQHLDALSFLVATEDRLDKLKADAEEIRDLYNELTKTAFGRDLLVKYMKGESNGESLGGPRKVSSDWIRSVNPRLLDEQRKMIKKPNQ